MQKTHLLYLEDFSILTHEVMVLEVSQENDRDYIILDTTIFYAQGGGQPADNGTITGPDGIFIVEDVRFQDGIVKHYGSFQPGAALKIGDTVQCDVDENRRTLHSRIHSAGHIIDKAIVELGLEWIPGKGYHFPAGPYIEYVGTLGDLDKEKLKSDIEALCRRFIAEGGITKLLFIDKEKMKEICHYVPDQLPAGKPTRVVMLGDFGVPCGGTHVPELTAIGEITVRKIKQDGPHIRIGYEVNT